MRDDRVMLRMSAAMHSAAEAAATAVGLNLSTWLRMRALEAAGAGPNRDIENDGAGDGPAVSVRFTADQGKKVRAAAKAAKLSLGEYIRQAAGK